MTGPAAQADWHVYHGDGRSAATPLPDPPPWRRFGGKILRERTVPAAATDGTDHFQTTLELVEAVNAAIGLRRPLLLTGRTGSGKSSLIDSVARELVLGRVLRWHVTSSSTLQDALYRYDALGRLQDSQLGDGERGIGGYLRLGPLGTALLPTARPRALLVDEIDKSDIDLPSDLLNVFERGEFEIPELARLEQTRVEIREADGTETFPIEHGHVRCREFPVVVLTSNGERDFPPPFLRRCVQFRMPDPTPELLTRIVTAHLGDAVAADARQLIDDFAERVAGSRSHATDQLLNAIFLLVRPAGPDEAHRERVTELLLRSLQSDLP
ncbi:AAA family ATPase [Dactylosporangium siamense]|uniref:ATPase AAA n=1 Tax=Dactylosporangium siamense TaxID=685454 RepID=A0A919UGQ3_9ACTN|nr:MoxR family ATPase [Dactylosporangium siamense]GIG49918.1 ATPase AAA [Dactylosporangium siamense]